MELKPGAKVRDKELAEQFDVSRTPVREALRRLEDEGLIVSNPSSVTRVAELNIKEVKQAFVVVASLHSLAVRLSVPKLTQKDLVQLKKFNTDLHYYWQEGDVIKAVEADDNFHGVYLNSSENDELKKALDRILPKVRRLEYAKFNSVKGNDSVQEHTQIIAHSEAGDSMIAATLVKENWLSLGEILTQ